MKADKQSVYMYLKSWFLFQGVMSGSYHVCPTNITFQFDTTFMYLMCILMFLKLYQVLKLHISHVDIIYSHFSYFSVHKNVYLCFYCIYVFKTCHLLFESQTVNYTFLNC